MCGIFGITKLKSSEISNKEFKDILKDLFIISSRRGKEASGYSFINPEYIDVIKSPFAADDFVKIEEYNKNIDDNLRRFINENITAIGHSRLVTNGTEMENRNNQPVIKNSVVGVHNGIIVNEKQLWNENKNEKKETDLDSEILFSLVNSGIKSSSFHESLTQVYNKIYGTASVAFLFKEFDNLILATNNGSLYYMMNASKDIFIFSSEQYILKKLISKRVNKYFNNSNIRKLFPNSYLNLNINNLEFSVNRFTDRSNDSVLNESKLDRRINNIIINEKPHSLNSHFTIQKSFKPKTEFIDHFTKSRNYILNLNKCKKCLLPVTFPFIKFDENGVCNFCNNYFTYKIKGESELANITEKYKSDRTEPNIIVGLSGGRDSCFTLHYAKNVLGLNPIAYSYDWGMLTDLARRNQSRMCAKLGVEHILISADIRKKRNNIRKNVNAWLNKPNLGLVPLFMAGDKQYFYYAHKLMKEYNIDLILFGENLLETTMFKSSFCGIEPNLGYKEKSFSISNFDKVKMMMYYLKEYIKNPAYINNSLLDSISAFGSYYYFPHKYLNLFHYLKWNENQVISTLRNEYDWETDPGTKSTWRIGDGTAAFYNYIYYVVAGFSEYDTFRSNQIREGDLTREDALKMSIEENQPRWDSIKWYCDTIGIDFEKSIEIINNIKTLY